MGHEDCPDIRNSRVDIFRELDEQRHRSFKLVVAWIVIHQDELMADWQLAVEGKTPFRIKGLDQ